MNRPAFSQTLELATAPIAITANDWSAVDWLRELVSPSMAPTQQAPAWRLRLSTDAPEYAARCASRPRESTLQPCFAFDQQVFSLPAWSDGRGVVVDDAERSCFFRVEPQVVDLVADPSSRRWRYTLLFILTEIATTRLRRTQLDVHAASVENAGRAILIAGPKQAGKTTLLFHLLREGRCRMLANDRAFVGAAPSSATPFVVRGIPAAVKIRAATAADFPELLDGLPNVERPYLYTMAELATMAASAAHRESSELALSPAHIAQRLQVQRLSEAPLGTILFPQIHNEMDGWTVEPMSPREIYAELLANLFGKSSGRIAPTLFETAADIVCEPSESLADKVASQVPGYRVGLGRFAYAEPDFASRLLRRLVA